MHVCRISTPSAILSKIVAYIVFLCEKSVYMLQSLKCTGSYQVLGDVKWCDLGWI